MIALMRTAMVMGMLTLASCASVRGSGTKAEETRHVPAFSGLTVNGGYQLRIDVVADQVGEVALHLAGDDNILPLVRTTSSGGMLVIESDENLWAQLPITVTDTTAALTAVEINGSAEGRIQGLHGERVTLEINGSGELVLTGKVGELLLDVAGSGKIDARAVEARAVTIDIAGSGEVKTCAREKLKVDIAGSGKVEYYCDPAEVIQDIAGSGELLKK